MAERRRWKTTTSAFGVAARIAHDSTHFYSRRLYKGLPKEERVSYCEVPLPRECVNQIFCKSSERMEELPDCSVHLMVTSPPYDVGKEYDDDLTIDEYRAFLKRVMAEVYRVLVSGGRARINLAYLPLHAFIIQDMLELGFLIKGEIIWDKGTSASPSTARGSGCSPQNPTLRDTHEYILVFCEQTFTRSNPMKLKSTISRDEFLEFTKSVWRFPAEPATKVGHPAPFPVELSYRLIQLYTFEGEVVLDPFIGSGTIAIAALKTGRNFVGYDISSDYVALTRQSVEEFLAKKPCSESALVMAHAKEVGCADANGKR
ncbi:MAG: DNA-methyltransferase [Candidatus Fervidibacter sp.]|uniref:DNA-methyltransferase n=1 Tax=Candidatus Fervidibacter sp. TaxID=3100871 RepID=UPI00404B3F54